MPAPVWLIAALLAPWATAASKPAVPRPVSIQVAPGTFDLTGPWSSQRILVSAIFSDGSARDATSETQFKSSNPKIAKVTPAGTVTPVANGTASISITVKGMGSRGKRKLAVTVKGFHDRAVSFRNDIEPLFATQGCNSAACHGGGRGKGGLRLSLFSTDPQSDYDNLVRAAAGRRINRAEPPESLVLLKASGAIPHAGQARAAPSTPSHEKLLRWLQLGASLDPQATLDELRLYPDERTLIKGQHQPLLVTAVFSDGAQRDVTAEATFTSTDRRIASIDRASVKAAEAGVAAVIATYLGRSAIFRLAVKQPGTPQFPPLTANNPIDGHVNAQLKRLGIPPSGLTSDNEFLRRLSLDVTGLLPTAAEARAFLANTSPDKRSTLINDLLQRDAFNDYWSLKWGDLLRIKSEFPVRVWPKAVAVYYNWLHDSLAANKPYDQFARELITATGSNFRNGPANFVRAVPTAGSTRDPRTLAETAALVFMGARIGCARCHSHPVESWTPNDDLGLGAFFSRVNFKPTLEWKEEIVYPDFRLNLRHPVTRQIVDLKLPGAPAVKAGPEEDPRGQFAAWLTSKDNPWFARAMVNRIWYWLLGRGVVHEPDDLRPTNPPSNPELLAFLEHELVSHNFDLRHIYRLILNSQTYQRASTPNEWNAHDTAQFSHYIPKRLPAEQMLDAISQFTETSERFRSIIPEPFSNWPANFRATQISDGNTECSFLDMFGRPPRDTPYEQERDSALTLRQTLYLLNSDQLESKLTNSPRLKRLLATKDADIVEDVYLSTLSRLPSDEERRRLLDYLARKKTTRAQAIQDAAWAILNTKEFVFNH
ncbi:MAG: DUF1553 domain-containing protein [Acidobacteria bacterium]|nr:DUF1553 domain-containing protein [Acidobacteriota bacterium]